MRAPTFNDIQSVVITAEQLAVTKNVVLDKDEQASVDAWRANGVLTAPQLVFLLNFIERHIK